MPRETTETDWKPTARAASAPTTSKQHSANYRHIPPRSFRLRRHPNKKAAPDEATFSLPAHFLFRSQAYCLSYTCTSCDLAPVAVTPVASTVDVFPSAEIVTLEVPTTLSPFLRVAV